MNEMNKKSCPDYSADQYAAHEFLTELRTRIATQPLPYPNGDEAAALTSLYDLFRLARMAIKDNPGCGAFAARTVETLNTTLRPITAKWHRKKLEGAFGSRDESIAFRQELAITRKKLHSFANDLHVMAYGTPLKDIVPDISNPNPADDTPLAFGIPEGLAHPQAREINGAEREEIRAIRRTNHKPVEPDTIHNAVGLALSGGGIRSASFCLGIAQVLAKRNLLHDVDVMSTVSGGGYVGAFLTQRLGARSATEDDPPTGRIAQPEEQDTDAVSFLRKRAAYLSLGSQSATFIAAGRIIAGMVLNWTAPAFVIALFSLVLVVLAGGAELPWELGPRIAGGAAGIGLLAYAVFVHTRPRIAERMFAGLLALAVLAMLSWLIHIAYTALPDSEKHEGNASTWVALFAAAGAALPILSRALPLLGHPSSRRMITGLALLIAALAIPLLAVVLGVAFFELGQAETVAGTVSGIWALAALTAGLGALAWSLNINVTGPHGFYREQLARTFIAETDSAPIDIGLAQINPKHQAPYHLINAAVNLPSSDAVGLREREGDFFLMSKHWSGSRATGYHPTQRWKSGTTDMDLATAVAISGAAVAPHMTLLKFKSLRMLLSFLNLRLGYWIKSPGRPSGTGKAVPGFWCLLREMLGVGMNADSTWLYLSDGGHIENSAVYELLRRRCKYIVAADAGTDGDNRFHTLVTLIRHARIDLGVDISPNFDDLRLDEATGLSPAHGTLCRIAYPEGGEGLLLVVKLALTGDESELIKAYHANHPDFPHQSTADQSFNEEQFEAYRQLGAHSADGLFSKVLTGLEEPKTISAWLQALANRLFPAPDDTDDAEATRVKDHSTKEGNQEL
ncbi:MAG: hypothetical protein ABJN52_04430 [Litorimonas sp.]